MQDSDSNSFGAIRELSLDEIIEFALEDQVETYAYCPYETGYY